MGGLNSKNFQDLVTDDSIQSEDGAQRVLSPSLDPRSPSSQVCRTPIAVEATPKGMVDPRSPTVGIERTPIFCSKSLDDLDTTPLTVAEPGEAVDGPVAELQFDESQESPILERSLSEPDLSVISDDASLLRQRKGIISKSFRNSFRSKPKKVLYTPSNTSPDLSPAKLEGKVATERSPLKVISEGANRSPRATRSVDVNSPRNILQRKHITKIALLKSNGSAKKSAKKHKDSPGKYHVFSDDKENRDSS